MSEALPRSSPYWGWCVTWHRKHSISIVILQNVFERSQILFDIFQIILRNACQAWHNVALTILWSANEPPFWAPNLTPNYVVWSIGLIRLPQIFRVSVSTLRAIHACICAQRCCSTYLGMRRLWQVARPFKDPRHQCATTNHLVSRFMNTGRYTCNLFASNKCLGLTKCYFGIISVAGSKNSPCLNATAMQVYHILPCSHRRYHHTSHRPPYISTHVQVIKKIKASKRVTPHHITSRHDQARASRWGEGLWILSSFHLSLFESAMFAGCQALALHNRLLSKVHRLTKYTSKGYLKRSLGERK
jgi:hypothetical protein